MASFELAGRDVFDQIDLLGRDGVPRVCDLGIQLSDTLSLSMVALA